MLPLRLAFGQTNPIVGDFAGNLPQIIEHCEKAERAGVELLVFGELAVCGYPLGDLSYRKDLVELSELALSELVTKSAAFPSLTILVGFARLAKERSALQSSKALAHNSAAAIRAGQLLGVYDKRLLPNYDVFDDWRNFVPGDSDLVIDVVGTRVAVRICEDIWGGDKESSEVDLVAVLNGSPFTLNKTAQRIEAARAFAAAIFISSFISTACTSKAPLNI